MCISSYGIGLIVKTFGFQIYSSKLAPRTTDFDLGHQVISLALILRVCFGATYINQSLLNKLFTRKI